MISHIRGYATSLKFLLNSDYDLYCVVKPGSGSSELMASASKEISDLSHNDLVVICSGSNDYDLNEFSLTFRNIKNYIRINNHTDILLMKVPSRYDLPNSLFVNKNISILNRRLQKLVKAFSHSSFLETIDNRILFTKHGLHRSKLGKKLVNLQLAHFLLTTFAQKFSPPISVGWEVKCTVMNSSDSTNLENTLTKKPSRIRKTPIVRSNDFFMANLDSNQIDCSNKIKFTKCNDYFNSIKSKFNFATPLKTPRYDHHKTNSIKIFHQNVRGLCHKINELLISLLPNPPQILCLTEHHLRNEEIMNTNLDSFTLGAKFCRQTYKQGGVCIYKVVQI